MHFNLAPPEKERPAAGGEASVLPAVTGQVGMCGGAGGVVGTGRPVTASGRSAAALPGQRARRNRRQARWSRLSLPAPMKTSGNSIEMKITGSLKLPWPLSVIT